MHTARPQKKPSSGGDDVCGHKKKRGQLSMEILGCDIYLARALKFQDCYNLQLCEM